jgi:hypothetical protein
MADRVDPAVHRVEPAKRDAVLDRVRSEAEAEQLRPRGDAVLASGERGDRLVDPTRRTFGAYIAPNVKLVRPTPLRAPRAYGRSKNPASARLPLDLRQTGDSVDARVDRPHRIPAYRRTPQRAGSSAAAVIRRA